MSEIFPESPLTSLPEALGPQPRTLDMVEDELTGVNLSLYEEELTSERLRWALASAKRGRARLRVQVAALLEERRSTNEALDDAVQELRARQACACPPEIPPALHQVGCFFDGVPVSPPSERPVNELTAAFAPVAELREVLDGEHFAAVHHDYKGPGRDLDMPATGGAK